MPAFQEIPLDRATAYGGFPSTPPPAGTLIAGPLSRSSVKALRAGICGGEFLGELFWETPGLEGDRRFPGEPRKEGRVLGETDRKPPPDEREADRALDGERDR